MASRAPSAAKRSAAARPIPWLDAATMTTLLLSPRSIAVRYMQYAIRPSFDPGNLKQSQRSPRPVECKHGLGLAFGEEESLDRGHELHGRLDQPSRLFDLKRRVRAGTVAVIRRGDQPSDGLTA